MKDGLKNNIIRLTKKNPNIPKFKPIVLLIGFIIFLLCIQTKEESLRNLNNFSSEIHLVVLGSGNQKLLNNTFELEPSRVSVNGVNKNECKKTCDMDGEENNVTLYFDYPVTSCYLMFCCLNNIKEVDLSNFDFSNVITIASMFHKCSNIEKITFGNMNTSSLKTMYAVFYELPKLVSLDLSQFDTSHVTNMESLFNRCTNLMSINLSNFDTSKVTNFRSFFYGCENLTSIDISHFDTSNATTMELFFGNCKNLETLNLGNMNTSSVTNMYSLFYNCNKLKSIDLSSFNTSSVTTMEWMFANCYVLKSLSFPETFITSNVKQISYIFLSCKNIISLNLSNFNLSKVTDIREMFNNCEKLKYLDISHFSPFNTTSILYTFRNLPSLIYLNIYSLEINDITDTNQAFYLINPNVKVCANKLNMKNLLSNNYTIISDCTNICFQDNIKLDIVNNECITSCKDNGFDYSYYKICYTECPEGTHAVSNEDNSNDYYDNGVGICLDKNPEGYYLDNDGFYKKCFNNCKFCSGPANGKNNNCIECKSNYKFLNDSIYNTNCYLNCQYYYYFNEEYDYFCTDNENCTGTYNKLIFEKKKCIKKCEDDDIYKYEYNNVCYQQCPNGTIYNEEDGICQEIINTYTTYIISESTYNEYNIIKSTLINNSNSFLNQIIDSTNNLQNIETISTLLDDKNSLSTDILNEPTERDSLNIVETNILSNTIKTVSIQHTEIQSHSIKANSQINEQTELNHKTHLIINGNNQDIYQEAVNSVISNYDITKGEEIIYKGDDAHIFHITNSQNELDLLKGKKNNTNKFSVIDLGQCGTILKNHYKINEETPLMILKFEKLTNVSLERSLQYEVYEPYNKTKLDLSICDNVTIDIYIPVVLSEKTNNLYHELKDLGYNLFDIESPFYQDICTPYKSPDGTDVLLSDRVNYYYNNEDTTCQSNCKFSDYLMDSQYLKCDCDISNSNIDTQNEEEFNPKSIYQSFYNVLKYSNYKVLKCVDLTFSLNSIKNNIGSIVTIVDFAVYSIFGVTFFIKGIGLIKNDFNGLFDIENGIKKNDSAKQKKLTENNKKNKDTDKFDFMNSDVKLKKSKTMKESKNKTKNKKETNNDTKTRKQDNHSSKKEKRKYKHDKNKKKSYPPKKNDNKVRLESKHTISISTNKFIANTIFVSNKKNLIKSNLDMNEKNPNLDVTIFNEEEKKGENLDYYELNNLEYELAKKIDKRNFCEIYWSLLKRDHLIIFTFVTKDDHNIQIVKYARFVFLLCSDMALNVFFFSDDTMHKMYLDYGKYNFIQQIPQIIYSTLVSQLIDIFLCFLSLTDKHYYQLKNTKVSKKTMEKIIKCIKIKISFFFAFTGIMYGFYWYFITSFCSVYENTQTAFIKDSLLSFLLSSLIPFGLYLFPSLLRIIALKSNKCNLECIYKLSNIIPIF